MKIIKTAGYRRLAAISGDLLAEGIEEELKGVESRAIARERAMANLQKDHGYYKKSKDKPKTGKSE